MIRHLILLTIILQVSQNVVQSAKQHVRLSESYLPVAMQVIQHLTDQMAYEVKDDPPPRTTTTHKPLYVTSGYFDDLPSHGSHGYHHGSHGSHHGWWVRYGMPRDLTTPFHRPGLYAPPSPPKPGERGGITKSTDYILLPIESNSEHTIIEPQEKIKEEQLLAAHNEEVKPLLEPIPDVPDHLLPYDKDLKVSSRSEGYYDDEINEETLQYLSPNVRDLIVMANDPKDDRVVRIWESLRASPAEPSSRGKLSSSNLRLLLLYDLLSRDAKRQRLSEFSGFSPSVMKDLVESSDGGARAQLSMALSNMVDRKDCGDTYANNRAKEMVVELAKDESLLSSELRYLQPLVYKF